MAWLMNLFMLGKGEPPVGDSFTELSCNGTPGRRHVFVSKSAAGVSVGIYGFLRSIARIG